MITIWGRISSIHVRKVVWTAQESSAPTRLATGSWRPTSRWAAMSLAASVCRGVPYITLS